MFCVGVWAQGLGGALCCLPWHQQGAGQKVEQLGLRPASIQDADVAGGNLTSYAPEVAQEQRPSPP